MSAAIHQKQNATHQKFTWHVITAIIAQDEDCHGRKQKGGTSGLQCSRLVWSVQRCTQILPAFEGFSGRNFPSTGSWDQREMAPPSSSKLAWLDWCLSIMIFRTKKWRYRHWCWAHELPHLALLPWESWCCSLKMVTEEFYLWRIGDAVRLVRQIWRHEFLKHGSKPGMAISHNHLTTNPPSQSSRRQKSHNKPWSVANIFCCGGEKIQGGFKCTDSWSVHVKPRCPLSTKH